MSKAGADLMRREVKQVETAAPLTQPRPADVVKPPRTPKAGTPGRQSKMEARTWEAYLMLGSQTAAWASEMSSRQCFQHAEKLAIQFEARWRERVLK